MKEWRVLTPQGNIVIRFPARQEQQALDWMDEHREYAGPGGTFEGMSLHLVEFETKEERIERELAQFRGALLEIKAITAPASYLWQVADRALQATP